eukprot:scaffold9474_cov114-Skeletonema_marinoi.AAC.6
MISQWRHRRRRIISSSEDDADQACDEQKQNENDLSPLLHGNEKPQSRCGYRTKTNRRNRVRIGVLIVATALVTIYLGRNTLAKTCRRVERYINNSVSDKYTRGMLFLPLRYLRVKWIDPLPTHERKFVMSYNSTFVLNLESDRERWAFFQRVNQKRMKDIQRIPSTLIHPELLIQKQIKGVEQSALVNDDDTELKTQQMYFDQYPVLKYLAKHEGMGTAACSLSHLRLFQDLLDQDTSDYIVVFEDDIEILDPLLDNKIVLAPNNADLILLSQCSLAHVSVSWQKKRGMIRQAVAAAKDNTTLTTSPIHSNNAIRVISGFSAWGYIITKRGARIILDEYKKERTEPMDVYFFKNANLKVYLPTSDWPVVAHGKLGVKSARRNNDN